MEMSIQLSKLVNRVKHMDINLVAGGEGISNLVTWAHMVESVEATNYLNGGEVIFITGIGLAENRRLMPIIVAAEQKKVAGIIINIGPYIGQIDDEIKYFCDEKAIPLFTVPWRVHLAEIMRIFCYSITKSEQQNMETAAAFKNAIAYPQQEEVYTIALSQHGFEADWKYACGAIRLNNTYEDMKLRQESIVVSIQSFIDHSYKNCVVFMQGDLFLFVIANYTERQLLDFFLDIKNHMAHLLVGKEYLTIGVGRLTQSVRCLYKSYRQALEIERLQGNKKISDSMFFYSDLGIYRLIMGVEDHEIIDDYYNNTLKKLVEYDEKNHSDLTKVLRSYLENNGSVKETAEELYVHRNTVNYKINKINELLDIDLSRLETRMQFIVAFMVKDMM